jgi:hypothetical protein
MPDRKDPVAFYFAVPIPITAFIHRWRLGSTRFFASVLVRLLARQRGHCPDQGNSFFSP